MLGIEFVNCKSSYPRSLLGVMAEQEMLTPMVSSYLLNVEKVRVAPTLNGASVIRIEPALIISDEEVDRVIEAVERTVGKLAQRNTAAFLGHLVNGAEAEFASQPLEDEAVDTSPQPDDGRFAFLVHPVDVQNYSDFDQSLASLGTEQIEDLSSRWNDLVEPFVISSARIVDKRGWSAYGDFICVPGLRISSLPTPNRLHRDSRRRRTGRPQGAKIVGLGAYTSVVTMGTPAAALHRRRLNDGEQLHRSVGVEAVLTAAGKLGLELDRAAGAVVGAGGAIGKQ